MLASDSPAAESKLFLERHTRQIAGPTEWTRRTGFEDIVHGENIPTRTFLIRDVRGKARAGPIS